VRPERRLIVAPALRAAKVPCSGGGGRTWWAHFAFTRMNTTPTILRKKIEEQLILGAFMFTEVAYRGRIVGLVNPAAFREERAINVRLPGHPLADDAYGRRAATAIRRRRRL
jgi:hypothetical protein